MLTQVRLLIRFKPARPFNRQRLMDPANPSQADASQAPQIDPTIWVDEYGDFLFRYANSRLRDPNAAEEVVQETFLAGVRYSAQFAGKSSELGWLTGILKRKIIDFVRARNKHLSLIHI